MTALTVSLDFETASAVDLTATGAYRYADDPSTFVRCVAFHNPVTDETLSLDPENPEAVRLEVLLAAARDPGVLFRAWNAAFERTIWNRLCVRRYGWPEIPLERWRCTMVEAAALGLPRRLDSAGRALGVPIQKDMEGHRLMLRLCQPLRNKTTGHEGFDHDPERLARLRAYCERDVESEMAIKARVGDLPERELTLYQLDQTINDRGVHVDLPLARALHRHYQEAQQAAGIELADITGGAVTAPTQNKALLDWLNERKVPATSVAKAAVADMLDADLTPEDVKRALSIRQATAKSSLAKAAGFLNAAGKDWRVRGLFQFNGADTGRWAGRLIQPQNMPARNPRIPADLDLAPFLPLLRSGDFATVDLDYPVDDLAPLALRPCFNAPRGKSLVWGDFGQVEARTVAWLAGEQWLLDLFASGGKVYEEMASSIYHRPAASFGKHSRERQLAKMAVLGCIAEGQPVLTPRGLIPIEKVLRSDLVWDGVEWVTHGGVIDKGVQHVIKYDGLVATPDHQVFLADERTVPFGEAASALDRLARTGKGRNPLRFVGRSRAGVPASEGAQAPSVSMRLRQGTIGRLARAAHRTIDAMRRVCACLSTQWLGAMAAATCRCAAHGSPSLHQPQESRVGGLWGTGDRIPVSQRSRGGGSTVRDAGETLSTGGAGSDRQQRPLRARQPALGNPPAAGDKSTQHPIRELARRVGACIRMAVPLRRIDNTAQAGRGDDRRGHGGRRAASGAGTGQPLAAGGSSPRQMRVYDLLNAGPRHRFTVSGVLVHNCGFGMGKDRFHQSVTAAGIELTIFEAADIVRAYRERNAKIVAFWKALDRAAIAAVERPGAKVSVAGGKLVMLVRDGFLRIVLPSRQRALGYHAPRVIETTTPWGAPAKAVECYRSTGPTKAWMRVELCGTFLAENVTQAVARDLLADVMIRADAHGRLPVVMHVHDEVTCETDLPPAGAARELRAIMEATPAWAKGLPLAADVAFGEAYAK